MTIFKYELKQLRAYTFWWSLAVAGLIFSMFPVYVSMLGSAGTNIAAMEESGIFQFLGTDPTVLTKPIGVYGFLTSFFVIAAGINGTFLGLKAFTKEIVSHSAEFLYTKPFKRGAIFSAKVCSALTASAVTGLCYLLGSVAAAKSTVQGIDLRGVLLIGSSFLLIEVFFVFFGALVGVAAPKIRTPLLATAGIAFIFYVFSAFASKMKFKVLTYFTPFSYFGTSAIVSSGRYKGPYLAFYLLWVAVFAVLGFIIFRKKEIEFIS